MRAKHPTANPALPSAEPRIPCSVKPKRSTNKTKDRATMETIDELLRRVINEAKSFHRRTPRKDAEK
jgi:hypothetical protein